MTECFGQRETIRLRSAEGPGEEYHATWFELFFDLVFVLTIARLAHLLHDDVSAAWFQLFAAPFFAVEAPRALDAEPAGMLALGFVLTFAVFSFWAGSCSV